MHTPISQEFASPPSSRILVLLLLIWYSPASEARGLQRQRRSKSWLSRLKLCGAVWGDSDVEKKRKLCLKIRPWFPLPGTSPSEKSEGAFYLVLSFPPFPEYKNGRTDGGGHKRDHPTSLRMFALSKRGSGGCISKVSFSPPLSPSFRYVGERDSGNMAFSKHILFSTFVTGLSRQIWQIPHFYPWTDCLPPVDSVVSLKSPPNASCRFTLSYEREKFVVFPFSFLP